MMFSGGEVRLWTPPLFSIGLILTNVAIFIYHLVSEDGNSRVFWQGWSTPFSECSVLIYNTFLRHQVNILVIEMGVLLSLIL